MDWRDAESEYTDEVIARSTLPVMFERSASRNEDNVAQRYKGGVYDRTLAGDVIPPAPDGEYADLTYAEVRSIVRRLAAGFDAIGVDSGDRVALYAETRLEWVQCDLAAQTVGGVVTTVYPGSSESQLRYLLADPGANVVVVENAEMLDTLSAVEDDLSLDAIVVMDDPGAHDARADVYTLADLHELGADNLSTAKLKQWLGSRDPDDLATIIYTSGTTGRPKGVKLTHWNIRSNINATRKRVAPRPDRDPSVPTVDEDSVALSFLPLAHVLERMAGHYVTLASGSTIAYAESADTLQEDLQLVEPNTLVGVPRVFEKLYGAMRERAESSSLRERIFDWASDVARQYHEKADPGWWLQQKHALAGRLVFDKVHEALGGEMEYLLTGGGTLSADLAKLYHGMDLPIYEGYGLTETSPVVTANPPEAPKPGTIGPTLDGVEVKVDTTVVPESGFNTIGETGELLVRGPNVFEGYWNMPDKTDEVFETHEDGRWFRTGDIATIRDDGYLVFHERNKQMLVTSTGKNVPPAPIEDAFAASKVVEQCMVVGDGEKFIGALVVPNFDGLRSWAAATGVDLPEDPEAVVEHDRVRERIQRAVDKVNVDFEDHEQIKEFRLVTEEFTEDNDLLTPTMKKKRHQIRERHEDLLADIYADDGTVAGEQAAAADD